MATYWYKHPRNFSNILDVLRLDDADNHEHVRDILGDLGYSRITRRDLRALVAWVNAENDAWGSNRAQSSIDFGAVVSSDGGYDAMVEVELYRDCRRHYLERNGYDN